MARQLQPCGTPAAYWRHKSRGQTPCEACRQALNASRRKHVQNRQEKEKRGFIAGRIINDIINGRYGLYYPEPIRGYRHNIIGYNLKFRAWSTFRNGKYPYYKWEKQEVRDVILPMQSVLHDLFPYNSEKPKLCKCCNGTGQRNG